MSYCEKFIEYFNSKKNNATYIEFELKLLIDPQSKNPSFIKYATQQDTVQKCKDLFMHFTTLTSPQNKQTVNFISTVQDVSHIKELHFANGVQDKTAKKIYTKTKLHAPLYICTNSGHNFKVSLSEECNTSESNEFTLIRYKQRFTFAIENWNIDFTFVKTSTLKEVAEIKKIKDKLFTNISAENIFTTNDWIWQYANAIEIEFEYTSINLTVCKLNTIISVLESVTINSSATTNINFIQELYSIVNANNTNDSNANTLKKILPNAIEINKKQYVEKILPIINNFYITDKADGIRVLLIINQHIAVFDSTYNIIQNNDIFAVAETIVECEMINDTFYAFDILKYDGSNCNNKTFSERLKLLYMLSDIWDKLIIKNFVRLTQDNYSQQIKTFAKSTKLYHSDGIIFTSAADTYKHTKYYKWKNIANMTIDFVARKCPVKLVGIYPYIVKPGRELYLLFSGIKRTEYNKFNLKKIQYYNTLFPTNDANYFPIQFSPSDSPNAYLYWHDTTDGLNLDNKIVELLYKKEWQLMRIRNDRTAEFETKNYFGNNFKVAELIWRNYSNTLTLELLCAKLETFAEDFYFKVHNSDKHRCVRKFNNMVKFALIERLAVNFTPNAWVVDLGCGKGQDLHKYIKLPNIKNALMIDNNENNLCEIIERKYSYACDSKLDNTSLGIYIQHLNLNANANANYEIIKQNNIYLQKKETKLIVCNFAIHYFVGENQLDNFVELIDSLLPSGGRFLFTCLNGEEIYKLLQTKTEGVFQPWGDGTKYLIKPRFTNKKFVGGEEIDILLPFSNNTLYKESLVNLSLVEKKLKKKKIMLESQSNFGDIYLEQFKQTEIVSKELDIIDLQYIKLVWFSIYHKK